MLVLHDKNQTLEPPEGFTIQYVRAEGEYLMVEYRRVDSASQSCGSYSTVIIYLNSMGREVIRTTNQTEWVQPTCRNIEWWTRPSVSRWQKFKAGFYLALAGIEEMTKCLSK